MKKNKRERTKKFFILLDENKNVLYTRIITEQKSSVNIMQGKVIKYVWRNEEFKIKPV